MLLKDKVVLVSGIGPGLGQELALEAARQGAKVVMCARTVSKLDDAERLIRAEGLQNPVLKVPTDIANQSQCKALVEQTIAEFGRLDVLINSAYNPGDFAPIEHAQLDGWRTAMDVNFFGTMGLTLEVIPHMKAQGGGAIVMINTMVTRKPMPTQAGYGASKAALASATAHLALELGPYNIRVNSAYMGWMWGPSVEGYFQIMADNGGPSVEEQKAAVAGNIPLRVIPDDADCAKAAIFLGSDYSRAMTGAALDVNGGDYIPH
ncbi:SDR family oxidoreductase [Spongiibacter sp. KMU-158]|uniref:SDR family oxidoreductase n=1 Tax=Spongiibacter pelagi TaxID=2760804 RepID=A0A927C1Z3_9GAMM|nr:SDR family oxidoreductase [Spongiibacter pelagi]MBD2858321.1 SDR family oxidoreductase [Spongiibacter pelagi]